MNKKSLSRSSKQTRWASLAAVLFWISYSSNVAAGCGDAYNVNNHDDHGKLDLCSIENELSADINIMTNWGIRPAWIDNDRFVFISNLVGNVYLMEISSNTVTLLTGHYQNAGYARAHVLPNKDLLLLGPSSGPTPPTDPLITYEEGRFTGDLFVLKAPYNGLPIPLNMHAFEGIAVSTQSNLIAWSDTNRPFFGDNLIQTFFNYLYGKSNLWTGEIVYDGSGIPSLTQVTKILKKKNLTYYEPQDFKGSDDEQLLFSTYGPGAEGSSDTHVLTFADDNCGWLCMMLGGGNAEVEDKPSGSLAYNEWEGIHPGYKKAFYERDPEATQISGPGHIDLHIYDFPSDTSQLFSLFRRDDGLAFGNPVFSPDGQWILLHADSELGAEENVPGDGIGIILIDYNIWQANPVPFE